MSKAFFMAQKAFPFCAQNLGYYPTKFKELNSLILLKKVMKNWQPENCLC